MTVHTLPPSLGSVAAGQFRLRQARAQEMVAGGKFPREAADRRLRPWLAIACLCGADLPELTDLIADERVDDVSGGNSVSEAEARVLVAREICHRRDWVGPLAAARDDAVEHHHRLLGLRERGLARGRPTVPDDAELDRALASATALSQLAWALAFDPAGKHPVPPFHPRTTPEQAAA